jgi:hypothetical protein
LLKNEKKFVLQLLIIGEQYGKSTENIPNNR